MTALTLTTEQKNALAHLSPPWQARAFNWLKNFPRPNTREAYTRALTRWVTFLAEHGLKIHEAQQEHVMIWRDLLKAELRGESVNVYLAGITSYYRAARAAGLIDHNPGERVKRYPVKKYGKSQHIPYAEAIAILKRIDRSTERGKRDYALMLLLLTTAVRVSESNQLYTRSLHMEGQRIFMTFTIKGGEEIKKRLPEIVVTALMDYLEYRQWDGDSNIPLFVAPGEKTPLWRSSIDRLTRKYFGLSPHALRHTAAAKALEDGADIYEVQDLLNHTDARTTLIYTEALKKRGASDKVSDRLAMEFEE